MIRLNSQTINLSRINYYAIILSNFKESRRWVYLPFDNAIFETGVDRYGHIGTIFIYTHT